MSSGACILKPFAIRISLARIWGASIALPRKGQREYTWGAVVQKLSLSIAAELTIDPPVLTNVIRTINEPAYRFILSIPCSADLQGYRRIR